MSAIRAGILTWDWRGSIDINALGAVLNELTPGGALVVQEIDTGMDQHAIGIAAEPFTGADAAKAYEVWLVENGRKNVVEVPA